MELIDKIVYFFVLVGAAISFLQFFTVLLITKSLATTLILFAIVFILSVSIAVGIVYGVTSILKRIF